MGKRELEFEAALDVKNAAEYLEKLAQVLREGRGTLEASGHRVGVRPGDMVVLELEAGRRKGHGWLEIELEWNEKGRELEIVPGAEDWDEEDDDDEDEEDEDFFDEDEEDFLDLDEMDLDLEDLGLDDLELEEEDEEEDEEEAEKAGTGAAEANEPAEGKS
ncbi:MAG: amphi-Trp domain-containing protein [Clostridia bacterium]|nr:MAG: amphi-Trp domain-containing protein [Clostridia bacterium]